MNSNYSPPNYSQPTYAAPQPNYTQEPTVGSQPIAVPAEQVDLTLQARNVQAQPLSQVPQGAVIITHPLNEEHMSSGNYMTFYNESTGETLIYRLPDLAEDPNPEMVGCAQIGCIFSWIPIIGIITCK